MAHHDTHRHLRLTESLRTELDEILNYELDNPAMTPVSVTEVLLTPDLKKAHIRLAMAGEPEAQEKCLEAIEKAKGYIRYILGERIDIYRLPDLRFDPDISPWLRPKAEKLLRRVRKGRPRPGPEPEHEKK